MKSILLFLKGILVGIGNMIAGISGGTIAFILGIYEKMIDAFASLTKKFWPNFLYLLKVGLGMIVGILLASKLLNLLFSFMFIETISLFAGLVIGGLYNDAPNMKLTPEEKENHKEKYYIGFIVAFLVVIALAIVNVLVNKNVDVNQTFESIKFTDMLIIFVLAIVATVAMLFPGISGSLVFMIFGLYYPVLNGISGLLHFENYKDSAFIINEIKLLIPLGLGIVVSLLFLSKPIKWLFNKFPKVCLYVIMGFVSASVFAIFIVNYELIVKAYTWWHMLISVFVLILGIFISIFLKRLSNKRKKERRGRSPYLLKRKVPSPSCRRPNRKMRNRKRKASDPGLRNAPPRREMNHD